LQFAALFSTSAANVLASQLTYDVLKPEGNVYEINTKASSRLHFLKILKKSGQVTPTPTLLLIGYKTDY